MLKKLGLLFIIIFFSYYGRTSAQDNGALELEPIIVVQHNNIKPGSYSVKYSDSQYSSFASPLAGVGLLPVDLENRSPTGSTQMRFSLRGSTTRGVLMLLDGQRVNDPQTEYHNSDIPFTKEDIGRIEVSSAAASPLAGPDAIGGAINIAVKKPEVRDRILELSYGSHDMKNVLLSASEKINNFSTRLSLERRESGGFREDTDFEVFTISSTSFLDLPYGSLNMSAGYQEKEYGAYDFYTPSQGYPSREWTKTWLVKSGADLAKEGLTIKPILLWRRHYDKFMLDKTGVRSKYLNHHRSDLYTPGVYFEKDTPALGTVGLNLEYGQERLSSTNLGKRTRSHQSVALMDNIKISERLSLGASFRRDDFDSFGDIYYGAANAKLAISEETAFNFGVSRNMRIPTFTELYYSDPTTVGNASLEAEKSLSYELSYDYRKNGLWQGAGFFLRQENDMIDWVKSSLSPQEKWQAQNIAASRVYGLEIYFQKELTTKFSLNCNYTYLNKDSDDKGYIYKYGPNRLQHLFNAVYIFKLPFGEQVLSMTYKKRPQRHGWFLLNSYLNYKLNKNTQAFLRVTNLLNVEYQEIEGIPQPGRSLEGGIRFNW